MKLFALIASLALAFQSPTTMQHLNEPNAVRLDSRLNEPTFTQELIDCQNRCFECAPCSTQFMEQWVVTPDCERHLYHREFKECTQKCTKKLNKRRRAALKKAANKSLNQTMPLASTECPPAPTASPLREYLTTQQRDRAIDQYVDDCLEKSATSITHYKYESWWAQMLPGTPPVQQERLYSYSDCEDQATKEFGARHSFYTRKRYFTTRP